MLLTFKAINNIVPLYITELFEPYVPSLSSCSSSKNLLKVSKHNLKTYGAWAFSVSAPIFWNSLPLEIRNAKSVNIFKCKVKTFLFKQFYGSSTIETTYYYYYYYYYYYHYYHFDIIIIVSTRPEHVLFFFVTKMKEQSDGNYHMHIINKKSHDFSYNFGINEHYACAILLVLEKFTCVHLFQIALETM